MLASLAHVLLAAERARGDPVQDVLVVREDAELAAVRVLEHLLDVRDGSRDLGHARVGV